MRFLSIPRVRASRFSVAAGRLVARERVRVRVDTLTKPQTDFAKAHELVSQMVKTGFELRVPDALY